MRCLHNLLPLGRHVKVSRRPAEEGPGNEHKHRDSLRQSWYCKQEKRALALGSHDFDNNCWKLTNRRCSPGDSAVKNLPAIPETQIYSLGWEDPLEKEMATHSRILAWRIPWTEDSGGPASMGWQRIGHDWVTNTLYIADSFHCTTETNTTL